MRAVDLSPMLDEDGIYTISMSLTPNIDASALLLVQGGIAKGMTVVDIDDGPALKAALASGSMKLEKLKPLKDSGDVASSDGASRTFDSVFKGPSKRL